MATPKFTEPQLRAQKRRAERKRLKQRKAEVVASEQQGDVEWQADIANRRGPLGYALELDPAIHTYYGTQDGIELGTYGLSTPAGNETSYRNRYPYSKDADGNVTARRRVDMPPGRVATFAQGATPLVAGHEYMHQELGTSEPTQRLHDAFSARTKTEWDQAVDGYRAWKGKSKTTTAQAETALKKQLRHSAWPRWERERGATLAPGDQKPRWGGILPPRYDEKRYQQTHYGRTLRE